MSQESLKPKTGAAGGGSSTSNPTVAVATHLLHDGYPVAGDFLAAIRAQVEDVPPELGPYGAYTAEQLCGSTFWHSLSRGERRIAGRCLASLVSQGTIPLVHVPGKHEYPRRYRRSGT